MRLYVEPKPPFDFDLHRMSIAKMLSKATWYKKAYKVVYDLCAPLYDPFLKLLLTFFGGEKRLRSGILEMIEIKKEDRVVDLCCGTGTLTLMLKDKANDLVGIDLSLGQIKQAKRKDRKIRWVVGDATSLPFRSSYFDKCIISWALHEMFKKDREKALFETYRVLKDKGEALICEPNMPKRKPNRFMFWLFERLNPEYYTCMDMLKSGLIDEIKEAGLKVKGYKILAHEWLQVIKIRKESKCLHN